MANSFMDKLPWSTRFSLKTAAARAQPRPDAGDTSQTGQFGFSSGDPYGRLGLRDAGSRNIGHANLGAFANIQNYLGQTGQAGADRLRALGIMPSYNGVPMDQAIANGPTRYDSYTITGRRMDPEKYAVTTGGGVMNQAGGSAAGRAATEAWGSQGGTPPSVAGWNQAAQAGNYPFPGGNPLLPRGPSGATSPAAGYGMGGAGGGNGGLGGDGDIPLEGQIGNAYANLIGRGGSVLSSGEESRLANRATDTIGRGTRDAVEQARIDAVRRGDTSGSSLGDLEARIRAKGTSDQSNARFDVGTGLRREAADRLLSGLGGASGYVDAIRRNRLLQGQLESGQGLSGLGYLLGGQ